MRGTREGKKKSHMREEGIVIQIHNARRLFLHFHVVVGIGVLVLTLLPGVGSQRLLEPFEGHASRGSLLNGTLSLQLGLLLAVSVLGLRAARS